MKKNKILILALILVLGFCNFEENAVYSQNSKKVSTKTVQKPLVATSLNVVFTLLSSIILALLLPNDIA